VVGDSDFSSRMSIGITGADSRLLVRGRTGEDAFPVRVETASKLVVKENGGSWLANSDRRIKTDLKPVDHALDLLSQVQLVSFRYTDDYREAHAGVPDRRYLNVVAQDFARAFPEHVKGSGQYLPNGEEILQVDAWPLTIYSAAAIQELNRTLEQKESEIAELRRMIVELGEQVNTLSSTTKE